MRTARMDIGGETYDLCFSLRVASACEERYGSLEGIGQALSGKGKGTITNPTYAFSRGGVGLWHNLSFTIREERPHA